MSLETIITLFLLIFLNSLVIFGFYAACQVETTVLKSGKVTIDDKDSKEIFWFIKFYSLKWIGEKWSKPIATCPICMASLHSLWVWIPIYYYYPFSFFLLYVHAVYMLFLCGLNKLILTKVDL